MLKDEQAGKVEMIIEHMNKIFPGYYAENEGIISNISNGVHHGQNH